MYNKEVIKELRVIMSHESLPTVNEKRVPAWKKALATGMAGAALFSLSGCGEKAGASEVPATTPAASAPKTPEAKSTPTEVPLTLSAATKKYAEQITPDKLKGQTELNMTIRFAENLPDPEKDPKAYGEAMFAGLNAVAQACDDSDIVAPMDSDGYARNQNDLFEDCKPIFRAYTNAFFPEANTDDTHAATLIYRMLDRSSVQKLEAEYDKTPALQHHKYNMNLLTNKVANDGTITITGYGQDFDGPDSALARSYYKKLKSSVGETLANKSAFTRDNWTISFNSITKAYSDAIPSGSTSGTAKYK